ncbi:hypothetical protein [Azotobacter vinelandii]|uniref:hypothetical protein n=1 Tax=Azotobacter vinelandii TaxID=354 RepID=UPI00266601E3|nr:hypothetical protein [Azotobacter vinelandii]WKN20871.1 hypothetical protein AVAEIV_003897 [Azotobacter vinelandii]
MTTKTTASELQAFWASDDPMFWPDLAYVDGLALSIDGRATDEFDDIDVEELTDDQEIKILGGVICYADGSEDGFEAQFRKWRKLQSSVFLSVQAPKDKLDEIKAAVKALGGTIR